MNNYQNPFMVMPIILINPEDNKPVAREAEILPEHIQFMHDGLHFGTLIYFIGGAMLMTEATRDAVKYNIELYWQHVEKYEKAKQKAPIFTLQ